MEFAAWQENVCKLKMHLSNFQFAELVGCITASERHDEASQVVEMILTCRGTPVWLIDQALAQFTAVRQPTPKEHGWWVESLARFSSLLWERRLLEWVEVLHNLAFNDAVMLGTTHGLDRLVGGFIRYAQWIDDPGALHLTPDTLIALEGPEVDYLRAWIEARPFANEDGFLAWRAATLARLGSA